MENRHVSLPPLSIRANVEPSSINDEQRTVEVVFSTGAPVLRTDWWGGSKFVETLSLDPAHIRWGRLNSGAPVLDAHSAWSVKDVLGSVVPESARVVKKEGRATLRFSSRDEVSPLWQDIRAGILRNVSVGYRVHKFVETAGKDGTIPTRHAIDWEPFEISMVPMGADPKAQARAEHVEMNSCVIVREEEQMPEPKKPEEKPKETREAPNPPAPNPDPPLAADEARKEGARAERERIAGIRKAVRVHGFDDTEATRLIDAGTPLDEARELLVNKRAADDERRPTNGLHPTVTRGEDEREKWIRGVGAWIARKAAVDGLIRQGAEKRKDLLGDVDLDPGEFRGLSLLDLARQSLERRGIRTSGMDKMRVAQLALSGRDSGVMGAQTTSDFTIALENVLNKTLLAAYSVVPDTWRSFAAVGSVTDFRAHNRYRTGFLGRLDVVLESGEFKNKSLPDASKESITATTKGNILALTRQAIVNDDMGLFSRIATQLGRAAALSIELDVYDLLAENSGLGPTMNDGKTLFHADHSNISAGSELSVEGLDDDRVVMALQTDPSGNEILDLRPVVLVLPVGLGGQARVLNGAEYDTDLVSGGTSNPFMKPNRVRGLFGSIVDTPRLSGTRRYLFADPALMPVIEVAFLEGQQEPFMEMQDGWRIDGVEWKVRHDYGVAAIETRGAVTNAGETS